MASLYTRIDSPFIWVRFYDKKEADPRRRRKSISTKLPNNREGWQAARELKKRIESGIVEQQIAEKFGIRLSKRILFSEGVEEYLTLHPDYAENTLRAKRAAVSHMIKANGDKFIHQYSDTDYIKLIERFRKKGFTKAGMNMHTAHLSPFWNYFVKKKYCTENIIIVTEPEKGSPKPIGYKELQSILKYYESKIFNHHYHLVYFLILTGMRISSALAQRWEMIDFDEKIMKVKNVKAKGKIYYFPVYPELENLLQLMNPKKTGRLFHQFSEKDVPKFFARDTELLVKRGAISQRYTFHNLRDTFATLLANNNIDRSIVKELLDHSNVAVTSEFYTQVEAKTLKDQFTKIKFKQ